MTSAPLAFEKAPSDETENKEKFVVHVLDWAGPFDVLLQVIEERDLNILDLNISELLEGYLQHIDQLEKVPMDEAGEFLVVAATLAQIKSKLLLPKEETVEEEHDPREELARYLMEYQKMKKAAEDLLQRPLLGRDVFTKGAKESFEGMEMEGHGTVFQLVKGFQKVLREMRNDKVLEFSKETVSVGDRLRDLFSLLLEAKKSTFENCLKERPGRVFVIATFLAVLELIRMKKIILVVDAEDRDILWLELKPDAVGDVMDDLALETDYDRVPEVTQELSNESHEEGALT